MINNKLIFVYNSSPQEKSAYCNFNDVNRRIDKFLNYIAKIAIRKSISDFTVVMAFTIKTRKTQIGKDCIINPLNMLKSGGHIVKVVYLRRKRHDAQRIDDFINSKVKPDLVIDSNEQYTRQAQELKDFISRQ
ncbi:hypothetical protein HYW19_04155 [Candidatus Woesearchaeota archaeon]|nr:hypothetical protein [Candidatus Woesearchaeota archaeon]